MPLKRTTSDDPLQLNLTPMIDVVFLLLIFFMTATQFAQVERAVELELPTVGSDGTSVAAVEEERVVSVSAEGVVTLDGVPRSIDELKADLQAAKEASTAIDGPAVLIHGDSRCDFQHVAAALTACRAAGIANVGVSVETSDTIRR
ncbi:biopolymer transport protein ExbD [Botrimarina colliarenosi]|uniref:Biopolymer transport protein ExbD n=1 Tax=Botrimarina colliarenosi TaxID=2528001 RepID=A0A5C6AJG0_9BACT|nr:biopolymer transporter ExbD [Botrimarina colliarenosi]TWU00193.1 biopolymer transport protein ExbD [Botrimarina colliarenosi]